MVKYIHIGYPKCFSTTLQRSFFDAHNEIMHLGIGCGSNVDYIDPKISAYMENYLVYARALSFREKQEEIKKHFSFWFDKAEKEGYAAAGVSLEHLVFSFSTDNIDTCEKASRLKEIFGENTKIIMIVRNQIDLLRSLYRESIRMGNPGSYDDFLNFCVLLKDRNFLYDFRYDLIYELYSDLFGSENILVLMMEELRSENGMLVQVAANKSLLFTEISNFLKVSNNLPQPGHFNEALNAGQLREKVQLNQKFCHDLGNTMYGRGVNFHRLNSYIQLEFPGMFSEDFIYRDVKTKRKLISLLNKNKTVKNDAGKNTSWISGYLNDFYAEGNRRFQILSGKNLSEKYFETPVGAL